MRKKRGRQRDTTTGIEHIEKHQRDILEAFGVWLVEEQLTETNKTRLDYPRYSATHTEIGL